MHALSAPADSTVSSQERDQIERSQMSPQPVPLWFERGLVVACAAVISFGAVGLLYAVLGIYHMTPVFLLGAAGTIVGSAIAWPRRSGARTSRAVAFPAVGMCVVALSFAIWNGVDAGHHVAIGRDPGVYTVAGKWLAVHGSLQVPAGPEWLSKDPNLTVSTLGLYSESGNHLEFQFNHLTTVLFAEADNLGGDSLLFRVPAVLGALALCGIYAVGCRLVRRPWLVLAAVTALAVSLPQLNVSRDTYSEPAVEFLLWVGLYFLLKAYEGRRFGVALLAGASLGATMLGRIDALVYLIPLPLLGALAWLAARSPGERRSLGRMYAAMALGGVPMAVLGTIDVRDRAGTYYADLGSQVHQLQVGFVGSVVAALVLVALWPLISGRLGGILGWVRAHRISVGVGCASAVSIALALAWTLRPAVSHPRTAPNALIGTLQRNAGLPIEPWRSYAEDTMWWFSWYLGPIMVGLAIVGAAVLVARWARRPTAATAVVLSVAGTGTALYLWKPSISPDQIWAMRRFVPAGLPLFALLAAAALAALIPVSTGGDARPTWARPASLAAALTLIGFPLAVTLPVRNFQPQSGFLAAVQTTCNAIGANGAVVFVPGDPLGQFSAAVLSWCNVPVATLTKPISATELGNVAAQWRAEGRTLWALSSSAAVMDAAVPGLNPSRVATASSPHELEMTVGRPPRYYTNSALDVYAAQVSP